MCSCFLLYRKGLSLLSVLVLLLPSSQGCVKVLLVLLFWGFRCGSPCAFNFPTCEQVVQFGHESCCHFSCSAASFFSYFSVPRATTNFSVYSLLESCFKPK